MTNREYKEWFIEELYKRPGYPPNVRGDSYVVRCPYCGDSSNPRHGHFYITIVMDEETPILYNCFKCPAGGVMNRDTMDLLEMEDEDLQKGLSVLNRNSIKYDKREINRETKVLTFDYKLPEIDTRKFGYKLDYIRNRLGLEFDLQTFSEMKVITSLRDFLKLNKINKLTCENSIAYLFERSYVGFLSHGNGYILFRDVTEKAPNPWVKYPITEKSRQGKVFYSMQSEIDLFTKDTININLAEGVFDIFGACYHLHLPKTNSVNIAVTGKYYDTIIYYLISLGLVGSNVVLNIFADNDEKFNKKRKDGGKDTSLEYYQKRLYYIKYLFKRVYIYYNELYKDLGVTKDRISVIRHKL